MRAPMDFSAWFEVYLGDRWYTFDTRHNTHCIGRIVIGRRRDAGDVPITMTFGQHPLTHFEVATQEVPNSSTEYLHVDSRISPPRQFTESFQN
jgi:transglutaminase-like putative cysteine protease